MAFNLDGPNFCTYCHLKYLVRDLASATGMMMALFWVDVPFLSFPLLDDHVGLSLFSCKKTIALVWADVDFFSSSRWKRGSPVKAWSDSGQIAITRSFGPRGPSGWMSVTLRHMFICKNTIYTSVSLQFSPVLVEYMLMVTLDSCCFLYTKPPHPLGE